MFCSVNQNQLQSQKDTIKKIGTYLFRYSDLLGSGNFSSVYSGVDQTTGRQVAVKVVKMSSLKSKTALKLLQNEILILKNLNNPYVIKCYDELTSINNCYIITQLCHTDLEKQLKKKRKYQEKQISKLIYDILKGLQYLNQNHIIHRDLKISNIFLTNNSAKIADFGFAIKSKHNFKDLSIGSPIYMSPEGLINNVYGPKTDVWSLGVLIYQLLHGDTPLDSCKTEFQLKKKVFQPVQFRIKVSNQLKHFIECCMRVNETDRLSISELFKTPYAKRIRMQIQGINISKQYSSSGYCSTYNSTTQLSSTTKSYPHLSVNYSILIPSQISYHSAVSLVHYCRLIHKLTQQHPSSLFSQYLLALSYSLTRTKLLQSIMTDKQQYDKLKQVILEYNQKYVKQHQQIKGRKVNVKLDDVIKQCQKILGKNIMMNEEARMFINVLIAQTKLIKRIIQNKESFDLFGKQSESKKFLVAVKNGISKVNMQMNMLSININNNIQQQQHIKNK